MVMEWNELECYLFFAHEAVEVSWEFVVEELDCGVEAAVDNVLAERGVCFN